MKLTNEICISFLRGSGWLYNHDKEITISERNKAIDDFVHECDKCCGFYTGNNKNLTREDILNITEQLKVGGMG